ncbi:hypothetical protein AYI70_g7780 [Smittium culicis]|uniref:Uncharacterized protein n=1 Tax=Smittium culicis TaxID=133412 RepID=A0A1R1XIZ2_9FUNG|nr:hypothetical protein AYI70_g7780 [Smittium culicis]
MIVTAYSIKRPVSPRTCDVDCGNFKKVSIKEINNEAEEAYNSIKKCYIDMIRKTNKLKDESCSSLKGKAGNELSCKFESEEKVAEFKEAIAEIFELYSYIDVINKNVRIVKRINEADKNLTIGQNELSFIKYSKYLSFQYEVFNLTKKINKILLSIISQLEAINCTKFNESRKRRLNRDYNAEELDLKEKIKTYQYHYLRNDGFCYEHWYYYRELQNNRPLIEIGHSFNALASKFIQKISSFTG